MTRLGPTEGLRLLVDEPRAEAADWRRYREHKDVATRTALFARFAEFTQKVAHSEHFRVKDMGLDRSDCEQIALEVLIEGIECFDSERSVPFRAYVRPRIRWAIRNALAQATEARANYNARKRMERDRLASLKRQAETEDTTEPIESLRGIVVGMAIGFMIEENVGAEMESVPSEEPSAYDHAAWKQTAQAVRSKLDLLPENERRVVDYHYVQGMRFNDIAALLGVSRGRISQIHSQALARLRKSLSKFR